MVPISEYWSRVDPAYIVAGCSARHIQSVLEHAIADLLALQKEHLALRGGAETMRVTLQGIADADWRTWGEFASTDEFEAWVKSRAKHALANSDGGNDYNTLVQDRDYLVAALMAILKVTDGSQPMDYPAVPMIAKSAIEKVQGGPARHLVSARVGSEAKGGAA